MNWSSRGSRSSSVTTIPATSRQILCRSAWSMGPSANGFASTRSYTGGVPARALRRRRLGNFDAPTHNRAVIGRTIGNYVVQKEIGRGGMGAVYLAEHPRLHRRVAIKVL